ncbi:MAG: zinc metallopeptidase [Candidatus Eiseniibacteriota bacterium]
MPFFDPTMIILIPALIFAFWAQWKVQHTYKKFSQVRAANGRTGREMALSIMSRNGVADVAVEEVGGILSDHYDPRVKKVRLSEHNYRDSSISSIAVAAHEVGHVLQHAQGYMPLAFRTTLAPVAQIGSFAAFPLFMIGLIFGGPWAKGLMDLGIIFFTGAVLFQVITLPVEFNASNRALAQLTESGSLMPEEVGQAKQVLDAAALTYVAAAAMAALQLLRLVLIRNSRD